MIKITGNGPIYHVERGIETVGFIDRDKGVWTFRPWSGFNLKVDELQIIVHKINTLTDPGTDTGRPC